MQILETDFFNLGYEMRIFVSWSGEKSRRVGEAIKNWLPNVHQQIEVFFSPSDIEKGAKWANEIEAQLRDTQYCLVCLTGEALLSPWINFETGAISKGIGQNRITPILLDIPKSDVSGPLSLFQLSDFKMEEMQLILKSINATLEEERLSDSILDRAFSRWWPDLEAEVTKILSDSPSIKPPTKSPRELTDEILLNTREIMKQIGRIPNKNNRLVAAMVDINTSLSGIYQLAASENYDEIAPRLRRLGARIVRLNSMVGKNGGGSLIKLKRWADADVAIEARISSISNEPDQVNVPPEKQLAASK